MGVDLFVNGRLRQHNILGEIPRASLVESYLHGQIFYNDLDADGKDRFTSSREGILGSDEKYIEFLTSLKKEMLGKVLNQWDKWRLDLRETGDAENKDVSGATRAAIDLSREITNEYREGVSPPSGDSDGQAPPGDGDATSGNFGEPPSSEQVQKWINEIEEENQYNSEAYARCFVAENLVRRFITFKNYNLPNLQSNIGRHKNNEQKYLNESGYSIPIRKSSEDVDYLGMLELAGVAEGMDWHKSNDSEKAEIKNNPSLVLDSLHYRPVRNVIGHTGFLTRLAKDKLDTIYDNLRYRVIKLLDNS